MLTFGERCPPWLNASVHSMNGRKGTRQECYSAYCFHWDHSSMEKWLFYSSKLVFCETIDRMLGASVVRRKRSYLASLCCLRVADEAISLLSSYYKRMREPYGVLSSYSAGYHRLIILSSPRLLNCPTVHRLCIQVGVLALSFSLPPVFPFYFHTSNCTEQKPATVLW